MNDSFNAAGIFFFSPFCLRDIQRLCISVPLSMDPFLVDGKMMSFPFARCGYEISSSLAPIASRVICMVRPVENSRVSWFIVMFIEMSHSCGVNFRWWWKFEFTLLLY